MNTWTPTNPSELTLFSDDELDALVESELVRVTTRAPRLNTDTATRCVRNAGLTNQTPTRWTRW